MKEYLKMSDVFKGELFIDSDCDDVIVDDLSLTVLESFSGSDASNFALHAINSHDELVAEVGRLRGIISQIKSPSNDDCMKFLCTAFRHCDYEIKGDFEIDDMKPAFVLYANSKGA